MFLCICLQCSMFLEHCQFQTLSNDYYSLRFFLLAVTCDAKAIPTVAHAFYSLHRSAEHNVTLPGNVKCNKQM